MGKKRGAGITRTRYAAFRGADFSTDPSLVESCRSPLCTNIVADGGGMPQKRLGYRTVQSLGDTVYGLFGAEFGGTVKRLVHAGTKLYAWADDGTPAVLLSGLPRRRSRAVFLAGKLWIVTGGGFYSYDGTEAKRVSASGAYVPTTTITRSPSGGGVAYEAVNLLTPYRKNAFQTDGKSVTFTLDGDIDASGTVRAWVWGEEVTDFTLDRAAGTITLPSAPAAPDAGASDGLVVQFPHTVLTALTSVRSSRPTASARTTAWCSPAIRTARISTGRAGCTIRRICPISAMPPSAARPRRFAATAASEARSASSRRTTGATAPCSSAPLRSPRTGRPCSRCSRRSRAWGPSRRGASLRSSTIRSFSRAPVLRRSRAAV